MRKHLYGITIMAILAIKLSSVAISQTKIVLKVGTVKQMAGILNIFVRKMETFLKIIINILIIFTELVS